ASDLRRLTVFRFDGGKSRRITLGGAYHPCPVTLSILQHAGHLTLRFWQNFVGVSVTLIDLAFAVLTGLHSIVESRLHLFRRLYVLYRHCADLDTGLIAVQNALSQFQHFSGHLGTALVQH